MPTQQLQQYCYQNSLQSGTPKLLIKRRKSTSTSNSTLTTTAIIVVALSSCSSFLPFFLLLHWYHFLRFECCFEWWCVLDLIKVNVFPHVSQETSYNLATRNRRRMGKHHKFLGLTTDGPTGSNKMQKKSKHNWCKLMTEKQRNYHIIAFISSSDNRQYS